MKNHLSKKRFVISGLCIFLLIATVMLPCKTWGTPTITINGSQLDPTYITTNEQNEDPGIPEDNNAAEVVPTPTVSTNTNISNNNTLEEQTLSATTENKYVKLYNKYYPDYVRNELELVKDFRSTYDNSRAKAIVGRAIWYMEYGYMVYGHEKYPRSGLIDCSNFVSLVYKDFGYSITSAARKYNTVGTKVSGVYSKKMSSSSSKYTLVGVDKLRPGDVFTFWNIDSDGNRYISHVALYMGKINGRPAIIQTCKGNPTAIGITTGFTYWYGEHFAGARRILSSSQAASKSDKDYGPVIPEVYKLPPQGPVILPKNLPDGF